MAARKVKNSTGGDLKEKEFEDVIMSIRLEGPMHERLRKLAFDRRSTKRDLIVKGLEMMLKAEKY